jgi:hypothetical protein
MDTEAKEKMENKFHDLKDKTTEELKLIDEELDMDLEILWKNYNKANSEQQNDIWNDIKYDNEQKGYIDNLLVERSDNKTR